MIARAVSRIAALAGHDQEEADVSGVDQVQSPWARSTISSASPRSKRSTSWKVEPARELRPRVEHVHHIGQDNPKWRKVLTSQSRTQMQPP